MLKIGETYKDYDGNRVTIGGLTKESEHMCWSIAGNWYCRYSGKFVYSNRDDWRYLMLEQSRRDLKVN